jgi:hypothetical protein
LPGSRFFDPGMEVMPECDDHCHKDSKNHVV